MITLYSSTGSAGLVVHWLWIELGLPHKIRNLDRAAREQKSPEYLKLNPAGVVPTLVLDDQVICEAAAIVMHLADLHPEAGLAPAPGSPARAQYYQWMFFLANTLQPAYRAWFYPAEPAGEANVAATMEHARGHIEAAWERVATFLTANGPYLLGSKLSAADFLMTMLMRWSRNMPRPTDTWPALHEHASAARPNPARALAERMNARKIPYVNRWLAQLGRFRDVSSPVATGKLTSSAPTATPFGLPIPSNVSSRKRFSECAEASLAASC